MYEKHRWVAFVLALFFSFFTYLYTYKVDKVTFWILLCLVIVFIFTNLWGFNLFIWLGVMVHTLCRDERIYAKYEKL